MNCVNEELRLTDKYLVLKNVLILRGREHKTNEDIKRSHNFITKQGRQKQPSKKARRDCH